jgi:ABC-type thiamine transport system ATPase subunit
MEQEKNMHAHLVNVGMINLGQKPNLNQHTNNNKCPLSFIKIMKL